MKMHFPWVVSLITLAAASPISVRVPFRRAVTQLDQAAFEEAQQPDTTATKAFAGTLIKVGISPYRVPSIRYGQNWLTVCRRQPIIDVCLLMSCRAISEQILLRFRSLTVVLRTVKNGTL